MIGVNNDAAQEDVTGPEVEPKRSNQLALPQGDSNEAVLTVSLNARELLTTGGWNRLNDPTVDRERGLGESVDGGGLPGQGGTDR